MERINIFKTYSNLPRSIYVLFFARVINSMGSFVHPFMTLFLTKKIGLSPESVGFFVMLSAVVYIPGSIIGGKLADHMGRKKIIIFFQGMAALCLIPCGFLGNSMMVPYLLILSSLLGSAAQPPNSAMMADLTNKENRKVAYSLLYLGINIGFSVGPLIAGFLFNNFLKVLFLGDAATTILSLVLVAIFVEETIPNNEAEEIDTNLYHEEEKAEQGSILSILLKRPYLIAFAAVSTIFSFMYSQYHFITPLQLDKLFGVNGPKMYGTITSVNGIVVVVMTTLIVTITKKNKAILNVTLAGVFFTIGFGMLYFAKGYAIFFVSTFLWTIGEILNATNSGVYITNHTPMSHRGRFNAIIPTITGIGYAVGPLFMGKIIKNREIEFAWFVVFICGSFAIACMHVLYLNEKRRRNRELTSINHSLSE